jgi:hypothetical protein
VSADGSGPERLGDVLPRAVVRPARRGKSLIGRAVRKWGLVAGERVVAHSRPRAFRRGLLTVEVDSSALLAELSGLRRGELLRRLAGEPEPLGIRDVRFVLSEGGK